MNMNIVIMKLTDEQVEELREAVRDSGNSELESTVYNHCYRMTEQEAWADTVGSYL